MTFFRAPRPVNSCGPVIHGGGDHKPKPRREKATGPTGNGLGGGAAGRQVDPQLMSTIHFAAPIRAKGASGVPALITTLGEAFDAVGALPQDKQEAQRWQKAKVALFAAATKPKDATCLEFAASTFRAALLEEGWLP